MSARRIFQALVLTTMAAAGGLWLLIWGLMHGWYPELQRTLIVQAANRAGPYEVEIDSVGGSLMDGLLLQQIRVRVPSSAQTQGRDDASSQFSVESIGVSLDLSHMLEKRSVTITSLEIDGVTLHLEQDEDLEWRAEGLSAPEPTPTAQPTESEAAPWRVAFPKTTVRNAEIHLRSRDPRAAGHAVVRGELTANDFVWPDELPGTVNAKFDLLEGTVGPLKLNSGVLRVALDAFRAELEFDRITAAGQGFGSFYLSGVTAVSNIDQEPALDGLQAEIAFTELDIQSLGEAFGAAAAPKTRLNGEIDLALPGTQVPGSADGAAHDTWLIDLSLDRSDVEAFAIESASASGRFEAQRGIWYVDAAEIDAPVGSAKIVASGDADQLENLKIDATNVPLQALSEPFGLPSDLKGIVDFNARVSGPLASPDVWALDAARITTPLGSASIVGSGRGEQLENLRLDAMDLSLATLAGPLGLPSDVTGYFDLGARLSGTLSDPTGSVFVEGTFSAQQRAPFDLDVDVVLMGNRRYQFDRVSIAVAEPLPFTLASDTPSRLTYEENAWLFEGLELQGTHGGIAIDQARSDGETHRVALSFVGFDIQPIAAFLSQDAAAQGQLTGSLSLALAAGLASLDADLSWDAPRYGLLAADRLALTAHSTEDALNVTSNFTWGTSEPVEIQAQIPRDANIESVAAFLGHPELTIRIAARDLAAHDVEMVLVPDGDPAGRFAGIINADFTIAGGAVPQSEGEANWHDARFGTAVAEHLALSTRSEAGQLLAELGITYQGRSGFFGEASIDIARWLERPDALLRDPHHRAALRADGIDLAWLIPRASARRLGRVEAVLGVATGQLEIRGSESGPRMNGYLEITNGELQLALVDEPVRPIDARLTFSNDEVQLEKVVIGSKKGTATASGSYRIAAAPDDRLQLNARFDRFALTHFPLLDARVDGEIDVTGSLSALDATGALQFDRAQISLPASEDPLFREIRILGLEGPDPRSFGQRADAQPSAYQTMTVDIAIDVLPGARIRERGADLVAEGQVRLRKKRMSPTLLQGSLQTTGGTYTFLGKKFEVTEGIATFEENVPPDPTVRLVATRRSGDVTVGVELTGTWRETNSRLISDPAMDDTEILSYLVFDKPSSEIGQEDDARLNAAAAQLAGNLALAELSKVLTEQLPINEISMAVSEDMSLASIGVETNVGEDIILRYDRALQDGVGDRVTVEWRFWKKLNLSLRSEYANGGTSGLDIFWSYEY